MLVQIVSHWYLVERGGFHTYKKVPDHQTLPDLLLTSTLFPAALGSLCKIPHPLRIRALRKKALATGGYETRRFVVEEGSSLPGRGQSRN